MPGMTAHPESQQATARIRRFTAGWVLGFAVCAPAYAASARMQVSVTVVEAVKVNALIGVPIDVADLIAAWNAAPSTNAGEMPLRLPNLLAPSDAAVGPAFDPGAASTFVQSPADVDRDDEGVLQRGLVVAVSAIRYESSESHAAQLSITVAFN